MPSPQVQSAWSYEEPELAYGQQQPVSAGIYHEATEAFVLPPRQSQGLANPAGNQLQRAPANFRPATTRQLAPSGSQQHYGVVPAPAPTGYPRVPQTPYQRQGGLPQSRPPISHYKLLIISICLLTLIIGVLGVAAIVASTRQDQQAKSTQQPPHAHATTRVAPTLTVVSTPTALSTPTTVAIATSVPVAGFTWCGTECAPNGFIDQYAVGWQKTPVAGSTGMQFLNPQQADQIAIFKRQDTATAAAGQLLANEIQTVYASQPGYQAPQAVQTATIGGETWSVAGLLYMGANQTMEQVTVCVTVHQGKTFILEFQAPQSQFAQVSIAYYNIMIGKFQFI
ncbi:hypothetical protein KDW_57500 [Dictyobacter vulcani]|uniref:PsbP C-terminal domain-containing protein n=2 Tax=Dictyobacter vulcani TaxID=2607529 RepID=A0A5J4KPD9_9CHLR|nr:hypothetical protein KDW_57500 [Dictyobacter vulcani]